MCGYYYCMLKSLTVDYSSDELDIHCKCLSATVTATAAARMYAYIQMYRERDSRIDQAMRITGIQVDDPTPCAQAEEDLGNNNTIYYILHTYYIHTTYYIIYLAVLYTT
jgi:hypothetical protein